MEKFTPRIRNTVIASSMTALALTSCSMDSYLTDPTDVQCDGRRTRTEVGTDGMAIFIVHGSDDTEQAVISVKKEQDQASLRVQNDTSASPNDPNVSDKFGEPVRVVEGPELFVVAGGGNWIIDARESSIVISGDCDGL